ncbi:MAG: transcriptional regulator [Pseudonocardiales bacterium]|nr:MAG: transcriptional regulator [Pseudonocardiales bacterium]
MLTTATKAARREQDKHLYNAMLATCPARQLLDVLSDKWVCLVLGSLGGGPKRHSEIGRDIAGVSQKMLTQTLRGLERNGMVHRTMTASVPVRVDYQLTELGLDLAPVMAAVKAWAECHMDDVLAARDRYDVVEEASA